MHPKRTGSALLGLGVAVGLVAVLLAAGGPVAVGEVAVPAPAQGGSTAAKAPEAATTARERADRLFRRWDRDGDGRLAREEVPERLRANFGRVDRDGDGFVSLAEHRAALAGPRGTGPRGSLADLVARRWPNVEVRPDLPYAGTDDPRQRLDLYLPKRRAAEGPLPVVVFIHGGAWRAGDKRSGAWRVAPLVETGRFAGASVGYRLTGQVGWPAQLHDCKAAVRWLKAHAKTYGLDPSRIAAWGSSAGGHLVAMLGVTADVPALEGTLGPHLDQTSRVACVVDWFGPTDLLHMNDVPGAMNHMAPDSPESRLLGGPITEHPEKAREASPITYVSKGDSPHLIMHGDRDRVILHDQSVRYAAALKKAGVPCVFVTVKGAGHGKFRNPEVEKRVRLFLEKYLLGRPVEVPETPISAEP